MLRNPYDYRMHVTADAEYFVFNEMELDVTRFADDDELAEYIKDELWAEDSVTGNGSGSYTFNRNLAEEYLLYNYELVAEAYAFFDLTGCFEPEVMDVYIRLMLLSQEVAHDVAREVWAVYREGTRLV